jgi:hypothetical protein
MFKVSPERIPIILAVASGLAIFVVQILFGHTQWWETLSKIFDEYWLLLLPFLLLISFGVVLCLLAFQRQRLPMGERVEWDRRRLVALRKAGWPPNGFYVLVPCVVGLVFAAFGMLKVAAAALGVALAVELLRRHYTGLRDRNNLRL